MEFMGSPCKSMFDFVTNCQVFHSGGAILNSPLGTYDLFPNCSAQNYLVLSLESVPFESTPSKVLFLVKV
jgi:hypothetical protein